MDVTASTHRPLPYPRPVTLPRPPLTPPSPPPNRITTGAALALALAPPAPATRSDMASEDESEVVTSLDKVLRMISARDASHPSQTDDEKTPYSPRSNPPLLLSTRQQQPPPPMRVSSIKSAGVVDFEQRCQRDSFSSSTGSSSFMDTGGGCPGQLSSSGASTVMSSSSSTCFSSDTSVSSAGLRLYPTHRHHQLLQQSKRDPLLKDYPVPPPGDINVEQMLGRAPGRWSLGHYFHRARLAARRDKEEAEAAASGREQLPVPPVQADRKAEMEEAKKQLLAVRDELRRLGGTKR